MKCAKCGGDKRKIVPVTDEERNAIPGAFADACIECGHCVVTMEPKDIERITKLVNDRRREGFSHIAWYDPSEEEEEGITEEDAKKTHPGFTITCDKCKGSKVIVTSDVGGSDVSGMWGGVHLTCTDCVISTTIWEVYQ